MTAANLHNSSRSVLAWAADPECNGGRCVVAARPRRHRNPEEGHENGKGVEARLGKKNQRSNFPWQQRLCRRGRNQGSLSTYLWIISVVYAAELRCGEDWAVNRQQIDRSSLQQMFKISQNLQVSDLFSLALSSKKKADGGQCVGVNVELPDALIMPPLQSPSRSSMSAFALKLQGWRTLDRRVLFLGTKTVAEGSGLVLFPQAELQSSGEVNCLHNTQRVPFRMQLRGIGRCGARI